MKKTILRTALASSLLIGGATAFAQPGSDQNETHETCSGKRFKNMTPEQKAARKAKRAERRAKFENMTPEQRKAHREARKAERAERLAKMTPEERAKFEAKRAERKARREARREERRGI